MVSVTLLIYSFLKLEKVGVKLARSLRSVLSRLTRSELRKEVKETLRSEEITKFVQTLLRVDFTSESIKKLLNKDDIKSIFFQLAQSLLLFDGVEVYSKAEIVERIPELEDMIYRKGTALSKLNKANEMLQKISEKIENIQAEIVKLKSRKLSLMKMETKKLSQNHFEDQSLLALYEFKVGREKCVFLSLCFSEIKEELSQKILSTEQKMQFTVLFEFEGSPEAFFIDGANTGFSTKQIEERNLFQNFFLDKYWVILDREYIIVAARNKFTNILVQDLKEVEK